MPAASVLLVDSSDLGICAVRTALGHDNFGFASVDTGQAAIDLAVENPTLNLILVSLPLEDMPGETLCRNLKMDIRTSHIPVVLIMPDTMVDPSWNAVLQAGADGILRRPISIELLKATSEIAAQRHTSAMTRQADTGDSECEDFLAELSRLSHAVNNPLQALCANNDLLALQLPEESPLLKHTRAIAASAEHVSRLVNQVSQKAKAISRKDL